MNNLSVCIWNYESTIKSPISQNRPKIVIDNDVVKTVNLARFTGDSIINSHGKCFAQATEFSMRFRTNVIKILSGSIGKSLLSYLLQSKKYGIWTCVL